MADLHRVKSLGIKEVYNKRRKCFETILILYTRRSRYGIYRDVENHSPYCIRKYMTKEQAEQFFINY